MRKNATKLAAAVLSLAMVMTSVSMPASAATTKKAKLNKTSATLFTNGTKSQKGTTLYVTVGGKKVKATFKSSNTKVLTVGKTTGKVTAKKKGTATVKATYKKKTYSCKITVKTYVTSLSVSAKTVNLVKGKTATIKTTVKPSTASNKKVSFKSSNTSVATVTSSGKVTAKKKGSATITVTALGSRKDSKKATVKVNVTEPTVTPTETPVVTETPVPTETPSVATEGTISVTTNITGAAIEILNGATPVTTGSTLSGYTYKTEKIKYGTYVVTVKKNGYKDFSQTVILNGDDVKVDAQLEEIKAEEVKAELKGAYRTGEKSVQVNFTNKIKEPTKDNFSIEGLTITDAKLSQDQKSVILTVSDMQLDKKYTVKTTNIVDANGAAVADGTADFTAREISYVAEMQILDTKDESKSKNVLYSDGKDSAKVVVTLTTDAGEVVKDEEAEITFTTTAGNFAEKKVTVQNGKATNLFTSEASAKDKDALLTATVTAASNKKLLNVTTSRTISMTPNISTIEDETVGVSLTDAVVETCDRVILYFNRDVEVTNYTKNGTEDKFAYNPDKMKITIKDNIKPNGAADGTKDVMALAEVPGNKKALYAILKEGEYLTDNSKCEVTVDDLTKSIHTAVTKTPFVSDIRTPSILNVTNPDKSLKTINVIFSEPVQKNVNGKDSKNSAEIAGKWVIDNTALTDAKYGTAVKPAKATVGTFDVKTGIDTRNVVTITLGENADNKQIYFKAGDHSVQGNSIGDWANMTDKNNNLINTQTLDFTIAANNEAPTATVTVESPEQFDVKFSTIVDVKEVKDNLKLQQDKNGSWVDLSKDDYAIRRVNGDDKDASEFIVELTRDWTKILDTSKTRENYYNYDFRLSLEKDKVSNAANGLTNAEINLSLNGDIMKNPDVTSPKLVKPEQNGNTAIDITMSEPVQINGFHQITPKDEQTDKLSLPIIQFISSDNKKTVIGKISDVDDHDKKITVKPDADMEAGTWKVVVRNISDDIGNTSETLTQDFVVTGTIKADDTTGFNALWVVAVPDSARDNSGKVKDPITGDRTPDGCDRIYIKFNKQIKTSGGADNAGATTNYTIDGYTVPSTSKIDSAVEGYNAVANRKNNYNDLVAIYLPAGTLDKDSKSHTINISDTIKSYTNDKLENGGFKLLSEDSVLSAGADGKIFTWNYTTYVKDTDPSHTDPNKNTISVADLQAKFDDGSYKEYKLDGISIKNNADNKKPAKNFTLKHTAEYDFNNFDGATGVGSVDELTIETKETGKLIVKNVNAAKITINAPNADVELNGVKVEAGTSTVTGAGTVEVVDILDGTLTLDGATEIENLNVTDSNTGAIKLEQNAKVTKSFVINTTGTITLNIENGVKLPTDTKLGNIINVEKTCTLNVESSVKFNFVLADAVEVKKLKINEISTDGITENVSVVDKNGKAVSEEDFKVTPIQKNPGFKVIQTQGEKVSAKDAQPAITTIQISEGVTQATKVSVKVGESEPVEVEVQGESEDASAVANDIVDKLNDIEGYTVTAEGSILTFKSNDSGEDVKAFDVSITGITTNTLGSKPGKAAVKEETISGKTEITVTKGQLAGTVTVSIGSDENKKDITVAVKANESASDIAKAIADAVKGNKDLNKTYTASADGDKVVISATNNTTAPTVSAKFA